jgi:hypothetical protein
MFLPAVYEGSFFPASLPTLVVVCVLEDSHQTRVKWNLKVVLICISFRARDGEVSSCVFWPFGLLPLKKLCSVHLPISSLDH